MLNGSERMEILQENRSLRKRIEKLRRMDMKLESQVREIEKRLSLQNEVMRRYRLYFGCQVEPDLFPIGKEVGAEEKAMDEPERVVGSKEGTQKGEHDASSATSSDSSSSVRGEEKSEGTHDAASKTGPAETSSTGGQVNSEAAPIQENNSGRKRKVSMWSLDDENLFLEAYNSHGCRWRMYHEFLPHKSRQQIQSHGSYLIRMGKIPKVDGRTKQKGEPVPVDAEAIFRSKRRRKGEGGKQGAADGSAKAKASGAGKAAKDQNAAEDDKAGNGASEGGNGSTAENEEKGKSEALADAPAAMDEVDNTPGTEEKEGEADTPAAIAKEEDTPNSEKDSDPQTSDKPPKDDNNSEDADRDAEDDAEEEADDEDEAEKNAATIVETKGTETEKYNIAEVTMDSFEDKAESSDVTRRKTKGGSDATAGSENDSTGDEKMEVADGGEAAEAEDENEDEDEAVKEEQVDEGDADADEDAEDAEEKGSGETGNDDESEEESSAEDG